jgi:glucose/arabinose dehydrogenase
MVVALLCAAIVGMLVPSGASASTLPTGFAEDTVLPGVGKPQDIAIAPNGRIFVAEKTGFIRTYDSINDTTPTLFADLRTQVHNYGSRGLLSIVTDPGFPGKPYVYVYYTMDAPLGGTPPVYGGGSFDACPKYNDPDYGQVDNCPVGSRISRLQVAGEVMTGSEKVLVQDFCQQYAAHAGGGLAFDKDGKLIASSSDGSTSLFWDYGQGGSPKNPCGDPGGSNPSPPNSEAGRLRAQDIRTTGDPTGLSGSVIRIDPATGAPVGTSGSDTNAKRIIAYGLRDAARLAIRPGTNDIWVTDRGGGYWEEFHRVTPGSSKPNFGWPCYENNSIREQSDLQNLNLCESLYSGGGATGAFWAYDHELNVTASDNCEPADVRSGSTLSGVEFYQAQTGASNNFPPMYRNALFFADRLRSCIWALLPDASGIPKKGSVVPFAGMAKRATDLEVTPQGDLLYIDQGADTVQRIRYTNNAPTAVATANVTSGAAPLAVTFDGSGSTDVEGNTLSYAWDLDGDNLLDDSTAAKPTFNYTTPGTYTVTLKVTDSEGAFGNATVTIKVSAPGTTPTPTPTPETKPAPKTINATPITPSLGAPVTGAKGPTLVLAAARTQHLLGKRAIEVHGGCLSACTLKATATISLPGASKSLKLRGISVKAASGKVVTLRIKLSKKTMRAIRRAMRRGKKVTATVTVIATDANGASSAKRKVRLKR